PDQVGNDPILAEQAAQPGCLAKPPRAVAAEGEAVAEHSQDEEVGVGAPTLDGEDASGDEHHGLGPEVARAPAMVTRGTLGDAEGHDAGYSAGQPSQRVHHERQEERYRQAIDLGHGTSPFTEAK